MRFILKGSDDVIYADNAATTQISDLAFEKMLPFLREEYGNASSQHSLGIHARRAVEHARKQVAAATGANKDCIIFTSGGSEANSWVLQGVANYFRNEPIHIITSSIEHYSILDVCHTLESRGVEITYLPVNRGGQIDCEMLKSAIRPNTKLISIMFVNNEIGTLQPIIDIGEFLHDKGILFHTDAVQAVGHIPLDVNELCVDFLSASAHKFNGAKGTGFLYKRENIKIPSLIFGGGQEYGERGGTENVAGIVALGYALEESVTEIASVSERLTTLVQSTINGLRKVIPNIIINGDRANRLTGTVNITFPHASGESMMHLLDLKGICVSTSSACNSGKDEPSHVLLALGLSEEEAKSSIRISYGKYNTIGEVEKIIRAIADAYAKIVASQ